MSNNKFEFKFNRSVSLKSPYPKDDRLVYDL